MTMNTPNLYWPVYKNLEKEVLELSNSIHFDDNQLSVYSGKVADLILRGASEIESIAKDLCRQESKHDERHKFDFDCLQTSLSEWKLDKKEVVIAGSTVYFSNKVLVPFKFVDKQDVKGDGSIETGASQRCAWNNAYQNLKHDKVAALMHFATVEYLFDALSALYILNIYYITSDSSEDFAELVMKFNQRISLDNILINQLSYGSELFLVRSTIAKPPELSTWDNLNLIFKDIDVCVVIKQIELRLRNEIKAVIDSSSNETYKNQQIINRLTQVPLTLLPNKSQDIYLKLGNLKDGGEKC